MSENKTASLADLKAMAEKLADVTAQFKAKGDELDAKADAAIKTVKDKGDTIDAAKAELDKLLVEHIALKKQKNDLDDQMRLADARLTGVEQELVRKTGPAGAEKSKSIGASIADDKDFQEFANKGVRGKFRFPVKAAITSLDYPATEPSIVQPQTVPGTLPRLVQRLFVRDLIPVGQTQSPAIFWVKQDGFTNNAAVVSEGAKKPESTISYDSEMTPVTTIAHIFKASKQILADFKMLRTDVDRELRYGLKYAEEQELLFGDGSGIHLHGIVPQATAYNATINVPHFQPLDQLRLAILQSQLARLPATGIVMHFMDIARVELLKDSNGQYIWANPLQRNGTTFWGLPVVGTEISAFAGKFLTGAFAGGAQIYDREEMNVEVATENNDDFEKNMITIRCEERLALAVFRPESFIYGTFSAIVT